MNLFSLPRSPGFWLCLLTLSALVACEDKSKTRPDQVNQWRVPVITVQKQTLADEYTTVGSVVADRNINISSRISSYISQLTVQEGETVSAGQLLIVLDDNELDNNINQARAAVDAAQAVLTDVSADLLRFNKLLEQGSISAVKVRKTQLRKATAEENLNGAKAALSLAEAQRQYTRILSPVTGIVTKRHLQVGSLTTPGTPLLTIESRDKLKFETFVAESQLANIKINDTVKLAIDNVAEPASGKITQIIYAGDPVTRSYKVSIALPVTRAPGHAEPGNADFYTGMFGRATFIVGHSRNITIPDSALVEKGGLHGVYVADETNRVWFRWLRIRRQWPENIEVAAGLNVGERIVGVVPGGMREGDLIQPGEPEPISEAARETAR